MPIANGQAKIFTPVPEGIKAVKVYKTVKDRPTICGSKSLRKCVDIKISQEQRMR
jgi:hypothetical protein